MITTIGEPFALPIAMSPDPRINPPSPIVIGPADLLAVVGNFLALSFASVMPDIVTAYAWSDQQASG